MWLWWMLTEYPVNRRAQSKTPSFVAGNGGLEKRGSPNAAAVSFECTYLLKIPTRLHARPVR